MADNVSTQIVAESPLIEAQKLQLLEAARNQVNQASEAAKQGVYLTPDYQVAGMSPDQLNAIAAGRAGIGAYQPYMGSATQQLMGAQGTMTNAIGALTGSDTRSYFPQAQQYMTQAEIGRAHV